MTRSFFVLLSLGALTACSTGGTDGAVLGVNVSPITTQDATNTQTGTVVIGASGLDVSRIRILVNEAKLHGTAKCDETEAGPFVVDLSSDEIAKGATRSFSLNVSPGTYRDAEIEIEPLHPDKDGDSTAGATTAELADFKTTGASILIDGTYQGKTFQYAAHFKAEQGQEGKTTTTSKTVVIPMKVDPSTWFVDAQGNVLDPTDPAQHNAIAAAMCKQLDTETDQPSSSSAPRRHPGRPHCVE